MNNRQATFLRSGVIMLVGPLLLSSALVAEEQPSAERLMARAREARTSTDHANVAKQYRRQAESFESRAAQHEADAEKWARSMGAMRYKWPAMAPRVLHDAKQKALDARRAARESYAAASKHSQLAVEALAASEELAPSSKSAAGSGSSHDKVTR